MEGENEMKRGIEEEAAPPNLGAFISCSGRRRADNSPLSIRFNPLKDLNVHLV